MIGSSTWFEIVLGERVGDKVNSVVVVAGSAVVVVNGECVGDALGARVGNNVGERVGDNVGERVGSGVGALLVNCASALGARTINANSKSFFACVLSEDIAIVR